MENRDVNKNPYKIMIVDDDPLIVKALERILFKKNYLFYSVYSGEKALKTVNILDPDIILLDVLMDGMSGYEVCKELSNLGITEKIPVIFLTSSNHKEEILKGFSAGAVDFIVKPFHAEELVARLQTHLNLKAARDEIKAINLVNSRFFSLITHDIKDSLTGVKGIAQFINDEFLADSFNMNEVKKLSEILLADSSQLYQFVESIIRWDQIRKIKKIPIQKNINLLEIINILTKEYGSSISVKDITVKININSDFFIDSNFSGLKEILKEIIHNAIKYCYPSGNIYIRANKTGKVSHIEIENSGVGLDKDIIDNIFRLDTPHSKTIGTMQEKGIGLGLIICDAWVKNLNGRISIKSEKLKSFTVFLELPDLQ
jgi:CheY-like chemotaxis protein